MTSSATSVMEASRTGRLLCVPVCTPCCTQCAQQLQRCPICRIYISGTVRASV